MDDVIVLENQFGDDGMCFVHLMSNLQLSVDAAKKYGAPVDAEIEIKNDAGAFHLVASWPVQGLVSIRCEGWPVPKTMVAWNLMLCESVTKALYEAANKHEVELGQRPVWAFMRTLPKGIENGKQVGDLLLFEADWMVRKCVAVLGPK